MNMRDEIKKLTEEFEASNKAITAETVVEAAKNVDLYPALYEHLWAVSESTLATEARVARAHRLLISVRVVTSEGDNVRLLTHMPGVPGYLPSARVVVSIDLASVKLRQLTDDVARSRARLREFRSLVPSAVADEIDAALERAEQRASEAADNRDTAAA